MQIFFRPTGSHTVTQIGMASTNKAGAFAFATTAEWVLVGLLSRLRPVLASAAAPSPKQ